MFALEQIKTLFKPFLRFLLCFWIKKKKKKQWNRRHPPTSTANFNMWRNPKLNRHAVISLIDDCTTAIHWRDLASCTWLTCWQESLITDLWFDDSVRWCACIVLLLVFFKATQAVMFSLFLTYREHQAGILFLPLCLSESTMRVSEEIHVEKTGST